MKSKLDDLTGVGPKRRRALLTRFGSLQRVREASLDELQAELGPRLGEQVYGSLHAPSLPAEP